MPPVADLMGLGCRRLRDARVWRGGASAPFVQGQGRPLRLARRAATAAGFTMVELVVVVASLAMLACVLLPVVSMARRQAQRTECAGNLRQLGHCYHLYADAHKGKYPPISPGKWPIGNLGGPLGAEALPYGTAVLYVTGHMPDPSVGYCPNKGVGEELSYKKEQWAVDVNAKTAKWTEVYSGYALYAAWYTRLARDVPDYDLLAQDANDTGAKILATDVMADQPLEWVAHPFINVPGQPHSRRREAVGSRLPFSGGNVLHNDGSVEWRDSSDTKPRFGPDRLGYDRTFYF